MEAIDSLVVISDTHSGCKVGLHPPEPTRLFDGGEYVPSRFQRQV